jgi:hypothetical protein
VSRSTRAAPGEEQTSTVEGVRSADSITFLVLKACQALKVDEGKSL